MSGDALFDRPANKLARVIHRPGGRRVSEAILDAEARLAGLGPRCLESLDERLISIAETAALLGASPSVAQLDFIYEQSRRIVGLGKLAGLPAMDGAAYSLCDLLDAFRAESFFEAPALQVHLDALRVLRSSADATPGSSTKEVIEGLREVVTKARKPTGSSRSARRASLRADLSIIP